MSSLSCVAFALVLEVSAWGRLARAQAPALASGEFQGFALATCGQKKCFRILASRAKHGFSNGLSLSEVRVLMTSKELGAQPEVLLEGREGYYDARTRSVVVRKVGAKDCFIDLEVGEARCF